MSLSNIPDHLLLYYCRKNEYRNIAKSFNDDNKIREIAKWFEFSNELEDELESRLEKALSLKPVEPARNDIDYSWLKAYTDYKRKL